MLMMIVMNMMFACNRPLCLSEAPSTNPPARFLYHFGSDNVLAALEPLDMEAILV